MVGPKSSPKPFLCQLGLQGCLVVLLVSFCTLSLVEAKKECFADLNGPKDDPNNIYKCADTEKCCQEGGKPSCCKEKKKAVAVKEQLQLWGTLAVMILILAFVMWYCRHDGDWCGNKKGKESKCCGCCCKKNEEKEDDHLITVEKDDDLDKTPPPAVYNLPDPQHHPPPKYDEIPPAYRDIDYEVAQ